MYLPIGLFGVSIATAALPDISRQAVTEDLAAIRRTVSSGLRLMLMLNVPATVGLLVLAEPIVSLLLERGRFTPDDTVQTAAALMFYAPGLLGYSAVKIASPTFYSLRDSRTPVTVSIISVLANLSINLALVRVMGFRGLALGTALAAMINAGALLWLLGRRLRGLEGVRITIAFAKISAASLVMGAAAYFTSEWLEAALPGREFPWKALQVFGAISVGVLVLAASARALRIAEFDEALRRVLRRLQGPRQA
jgi:putative peptidoglycan lipid II flippase